MAQALTTDPVAAQLPLTTIIGTPEVFANTYNGKVYWSVKPGGLEAIPSFDQNRLLSPATAIPTGGIPFSEGTPIEIRMRSNYFRGVGEIPFLELGLQETGKTNSVTPTAVAKMIKNIQIGVNGTATPSVQLITQEGLEDQFQMYNTSQMKSLALGDMLNMNNETFRGENAIPPGGFKLVSIPLSQSLLSQLMPDTLDTDTVVIVTPSTVPVITGSGVLALTSCNIRFQNTVNTKADEKRIAMVKSEPFIFTYCNTVKNEQPYLLTAGTATSVGLGFLTNTTNMGLSIRVRSSLAYTAGANSTYAQLGGLDETTGAGSIDILNSAGTSILGAPYTLYNCRNGCQHVDNATAGILSQTVPVYFIWFGENAQDVIFTGNYRGGYSFTGNEILSIKPGNSFTTGTYQVTLTCYQQRKLIQLGTKLVQAS